MGVIEDDKQRADLRKQAIRRSAGEVGVVDPMHINFDTMHAAATNGLGGILQPS